MHETSWPWLITVALLMIGLTVVASAELSGIERPNIVFMLSDDQSWDGLSVAMHPGVPDSSGGYFHTPNLDRLTKEGMRFSAAYAPAPVCSPTRISLMTGRSPAALHWTKAGPSIRANSNPKLLPPRSRRSIEAEQVTFAELLQRAGYATAHFGKWHLGGGGPERHGFDVSDGNLGNEASGKFTDPNPVDIFGMAERAERFMAESKQRGRPFLVQLSWLALHSPENAMQSTLAKYQDQGNLRNRQARRAAITEDLDTGVGRVLDALERLGLAENTYVIYMSDNGGSPGDGGPDSAIAGGKGSLWERGIRVPLIVRGPGVAPGSWAHERVVGYDLYPTFLEWAGVAEVPEPVADVLEGGSIAGLLTGQTEVVERPREGLVFHFPHYQAGDGPHSAIFLGRYKLIKFYEMGRVALFDLEADLGERNDLSEKLSERARDLERRLDTYLALVDAQLPEPNPAYDPKQPTQTERSRGRPGQEGQRPDRPRRGQGRDTD